MEYSEHLCKENSIPNVDDWLARSRSRFIESRGHEASSLKKQYECPSAGRFGSHPTGFREMLKQRCASEHHSCLKQNEVDLEPKNGHQVFGVSHRPPCSGKIGSA